MKKERKREWFTEPEFVKGGRVTDKERGRAKGKRMAKRTRRVRGRRKKR